MEKQMLTDLKYLIGEHILEETDLHQKIHRLYHLRFGDGWINERLNALRASNGNPTISNDINSLYLKYPEQSFQSGGLLHQLEEILDHTLAIIQYSQTPAMMNDQQQAEFVIQQIDAKKSMYTIHFNRLQAAITPLQNQINALYMLFRKMIYLNDHHVAWSYFGFDVTQNTILQPVHAQNLNFNHMLITPEQLNLKHQVSFMGLTCVFEYIHQVFTSFLAVKSGTTFFQLSGNVKKYFPQMAALVESTQININYKNQMITQLSETLSSLYQYVLNGDIVAVPAFNKED